MSLQTTRASFLLRLRDRADGLTWAEFHACYGHMLYRYLRARGASHADAEDVVQDVEMQLLGAIEDFNYDASRGRFRAYLRSAALHALARHTNKQSRQPTPLDPQRFDYVTGKREAQADALWQREWELQQLRQALQTIAHEFEPTTLKAFEMYTLGGCPALDTAEALGLSKWSVYRAKYRVLERLRIQLAQTGSDQGTGWQPPPRTG